MTYGRKTKITFTVGFVLKCTISIYLICLSLLIMVESSAGDSNYFRKNGLVTTARFCEYSWFQVTCPGDEEIIVVEKAIFGGMNLGKCIKEHNKNNCSKDFAERFVSLCFGRRNCSLHIEELMVAMSDWCKTNKLQLDIDYYCLKVTKPTCDVNVEVLPSEGNSSNIIAYSGRQRSCDWFLRVAPYNSVRVYLQLFNVSGNEQLLSKAVGVGLCYATIEEVSANGTISKTQQLCDDGSRDVAVYDTTSRPFQLRVVFKEANQTKRFLMSYEAVGCPNIPRPTNAKTIKETDKELEFSCDSSEHIWNLTCVGNQWMGNTFNCSAQDSLLQEIERNEEAASANERYSLFNILAVVAIGILIGMLIGAALLVIVFIRRRRLQRQKIHDQAEYSMKTYLDNEVFVNSEGVVYVEGRRTPLVYKRDERLPADGATLLLRDCCSDEFRSNTSRCNTNRHHHQEPLPSLPSENPGNSPVYGVIGDSLFHPDTSPLSPNSANDPQPRRISQQDRAYWTIGEEQRRHGNGVARGQRQPHFIYPYGTYHPQMSRNGNVEPQYFVLDPEALRRMQSGSAPSVHCCTLCQATSNRCGVAYPS